MRMEGLASRVLWYCMCVRSLRKVSGAFVDKGAEGMDALSRLGVYSLRLAPN